MCIICIIEEGNPMATKTAKAGLKSIFRPDTNQTNTILKAARKSATNAIRASKALGLSITFLKNGEIIKESPNGHQVKVKETQHNKHVNIKVGTVLYAKK